MVRQRLAVEPRSVETLVVTKVKARYKLFHTEEGEELGEWEVREDLVTGRTEVKLKQFDKDGLAKACARGFSFDADRDMQRIIRERYNRFLTDTTFPIAWNEDDAIETEFGERKWL